MGSFPHELTGYRHISDAATRAQFEREWGVPLDSEPGLRNYMADQIARNFATQAEEAAAAASAEHIRLYWDPRMKAAILAHDRTALSPIVAAAVERL